jgi:glutamate/tyrosine decarboxylase-like PLP-dependent enzyme
LQLYGIKPFRAGLEEKMLLAQYFYKEIIKFNFETGPEPALSVMIYRFVPEKIKNNTAAVNTFNESLLTSVLEDGRVFISSTTIDGIYWLRLAVLSFRTHLKHIQILLEILREKTSGL